MKGRQRWRTEEDALLRAYVKDYGPHEWHLVSQRMNISLDRDPKSCKERWKNYLKPGIKKGALTAEEEQLVVRLQAKHGNKWKKIASEVPGRTAKRLGKWWEVYKEKQERSTRVDLAVELHKYDRILENFAEKIAKDQGFSPLLMATPSIPQWLSNSNGHSSARPAPSPSVALTLSPATTEASVHMAPPFNHPWIQTARGAKGSFPGAEFINGHIVSELVDCCKELEEDHQAWVAHRKEAAWRLRRVELQLESEKLCKKREKAEEFEAKMRALRDEQQLAMERIEAEYREQIAGLKREAEAKEQKMADQWAAKHLRMSKFLEHLQMSEINGL